jgi:glycogen debranching enzyme
MQVSELIEILQEMPQDAEVHFAYNYGDHWRTQVAPKVGEVYEGTVTYSDYHRMPKVVERDYDEEDDNTEDKESQVVIIT